MAELSETQVIDGNFLSSEYAGSSANFNSEGGVIASTVYAGLFSAGSGNYYLCNHPDWTTFVNKWSEIAPIGLRLVSIDTGDGDPSTTWYLGAWMEMSGGYALWRTGDWTSFMATFNNKKSSMRLLDFDIHPSSGSRFYTGTWGSTPINQTIVHDASWVDFVAQWKTLSNQGMRLCNVQVFPTATTWHLTGLFEQGSGRCALLAKSDWAGFYKYYQDNQGTVELIDFHVYDDNHTTRRWYIGVWRETSSNHQFIFGQDWGSFVNQWTQLAGQGLRLKKAIRYPNQADIPLPKWDEVFESKLGSTAPGYCYSVMQNGRVVVGQGVNKARGAQDAPMKAWNEDTRINLGSVSKPVTAVAVMRLLSDHHLSVDDPFYPFVQSQFPDVGQGVDTVTIRNLLEMKSGMVPDSTLDPTNIWTFLSTYLKAQDIPPGAPGSVSAYSNTNYTILQAIIDTMTGHGGQMPDYYTTYVTEKVLVPMGINPTVFNATPDPQSSSTLYYSSASDLRHGEYWGPFTCVAAGGWVSSAKELAKFLTGVRSNVVLSPEATRLMLDGQLGWNAYDGVFGRYFHHSGGLRNGATPAQGLGTGIIRLADGYDALLLVNSWQEYTVGLMIEAFEARDVSRRD